MNVAIVEFNAYHDEILPTLVYALNALGATPDVYLPSRAARRDAFALTSGLRYRVRPIDGRSRLRATLSRLRGTPARHRRYDLLVMNSIEPEGALEAASRIDLPTLAVVHNADLLRTGGPYRTFLAEPRRAPIFLGRHVSRGQGLADDGGWLAPVFLGDLPVGAGPALDPGDERTVLCVQGNVEYARRDYDGLLDATVALAAERADFVVRIVGRSATRDGRDLRTRAIDRGVADRFTFTRGEVSHRRYLTLVGTSDFILPLVDDRTPDHARYLREKITSSMSMSIGLGVVPIADACAATAYGVEPAAVAYGPGGLTDAIRTALDMSPDARAERVAALAGIRARLLASSVANLGAAIDGLGVAR